MCCEVEFGSLFVSMEGRIKNGIKVRTRCYGRHHKGRYEVNSCRRSCMSVTLLAVGLRRRRCLSLLSRRRPLTCCSHFEGHTVTLSINVPIRVLSINSYGNFFFLVCYCKARPHVAGSYNPASPNARYETVSDALPPSRAVQDRTLLDSPHCPRHGAEQSKGTDVCRVSG